MRVDWHDADAQLRPEGPSNASQRGRRIATPIGDWHAGTFSPAHRARMHCRTLPAYRAHASTARRPLQFECCHVWCEWPGALDQEVSVCDYHGMDGWCTS